MIKKKVVLAVGAHPDDIEFTASGTIAKLVEEGIDVCSLNIFWFRPVSVNKEDLERGDVYSDGCEPEK